MCEHRNLKIIPTEENSWGIAETYHVKCCDCKKILFTNVLLEHLNIHALHFQDAN